jgi:hypothetical protein
MAGAADLCVVEARHGTVGRRYRHMHFAVLADALEGLVACIALD